MSPAYNKHVRRLLRGGVDLHCHSAPSPYPRRFDHVTAARHYVEGDFRAVVVKSHHHTTAFDIAALRPHGLGTLPIHIIGGVALNGPVGGINPRAVDVTLRMGGRVIWMPTIAAHRHIEFHEHNHDAFPHPDRPLLPELPVEVLTVDGDLREECVEVLKLVAESDAVLASGHLSPHEIVAVFEGATEFGITRLLLNHPNFIIDASYRDAENLVGLGALVEHNLSLYDDDSIFHRWDVSVLAKWIDTIGPDHTVLASDLGQERNPNPLDSYMKVCSALLECGVSERTLRQIVVENPARLLGLEP